MTLIQPVTTAALLDHAERLLQQAARAGRPIPYRVYAADPMGRVTAIDTPPPQDVADLAAIDALLDLHLRALRPALVVLQTPSAPAEVTLQAMAWRDDEAGRRIVPQPTSA